MSYHLQLVAGERERIHARFAPNTEKMRVISALVKSQVDQRFETEGGSSGTPWPSPKFTTSIGRPDGRKLLQGRTGNLRESYHQSSDNSTATVESDNVAAIMGQQGTVGKGGELPDIVPKRAKMLFIPISERAMDSEPVTAFGKRQRQAMDGAPLVHGRIVQGQLTPPDADFILVHKVSIPVREQLPASNAEREAQTDLVVKVIKDGPEA